MTWSKAANFSLLRKIQHHIKDGTLITLCEDGKNRYFKAISLLEMGIDDNFTFKYSNREEFLKSVLFLSQVTSMREVPKEPVIILECKTDIDIAVVILVEVKRKGVKKWKRENYKKFCQVFLYLYWLLLW